jgi:hyperpolarization activated cyclic nucleotide-gated potassium channel 1
MLDQMFGHRFVENTFFKGLSTDCVAQLMKTCKQVQVNAGENIYNTNQISNGSNMSVRIVYLILSGRVNCILKRNISFKTYVTGSYFGEIEVFKSARRMFTVRAETATKLAVIDLDTLIDVFSAHPQSHHIIFKKALDRYISFRQSMIRAEPYQMITMNSPFWDVEDGNEETVLHSRIQEWLEVVVRHREEEKKNR